MQIAINTISFTTEATQPPPTDATALIQSALDRCGAVGGGTVFIPAGVWHVSQLTMRNGVTLCGETGSVLFLDSYSPCISCYNISNFAIKNISIFSSGAVYTGQNQMVDNGQVGILINHCARFNVENIHVDNLMGTGVRYENTENFLAQTGMFSSISITNCYRGVHTVNCGEYSTWANLHVMRCVFGVHVESGNNIFTCSKAVFCAVGVKVSGGVNPGHGIFAGFESNHNNYNLVTVDLTIGQTFDGCHFIGDQSGGNSGLIQIVNSRGVSIANGEIGSNIVITGGLTPGAVLLANNYIRSDLAGFSPPVNSSGCPLLVKDNYDNAGVWIP